jgi:hypothetical protein
MHEGPLVHAWQLGKSEGNSLAAPRSPVAEPVAGMAAGAGPGLLDILELGLLEPFFSLPGCKQSFPDGQPLFFPGDGRRREAQGRCGRCGEEIAGKCAAGRAFSVVLAAAALQATCRRGRALLNTGAASPRR